MAAAATDRADTNAVLEILAPEIQRLPVVLSSPHSGRRYSRRFLAASRLDPLTIRMSEDGYVDDIFGDAPVRGAPLLKALFPRAFLDANREAFELDPEMFEDRLPSYVNTRSPRVAAGLGTIARIVAQGHEIYRGKLRFSEALNRIQRHYLPYHAALNRLVDQTCARFGYCLLIDCHSMPSGGRLAAGDDAAGRPVKDHGKPVDFVLGDCHGSSCASLVVETAACWLSDQRFAVSHNQPYAGGYTVRHYGRPRVGVHAMQIEINRGLYMDETLMTRKPFLTDLADCMAGLVETLGRLDLSTRRP